jgi:altronate hydrolase
VKLIVLHDGDDVAVTVEDLAPGVPIEVEGCEAFASVGRVPAGHKIALRDIAAGASVHKYGSAIGVATHDIRQGEHVHIHNLVSARARTGVAR